MPRGDRDPRFIHEFELAPTPQQARLLGIRLDLARQMYNAFLGEAWGRVKGGGKLSLLSLFTQCIRIRGGK
jgi:hypothetical protein